MLLRAFTRALSSNTQTDSSEDESSSDAPRSRSTSSSLSSSWSNVFSRVAELSDKPREERSVLSHTFSWTVGWDLQDNRAAYAAHRRAIARSTIVVCLTAVLCVWPWAFFGRDAVADCDRQLEGLTAAHNIALDSRTWHVMLVTAGFFMLLMTGLVCISQMQWWYISPQMIAIRWHVFLAWSIGAAMMFAEIWLWCDLPEDTLEEGSADFVVVWPQPMNRLLWVIIENGVFFFFIWHFHIIGTHLARLENAFGSNLGSRWIFVLVALGYVDTTAVCVLEIAADPTDTKVDAFVQFSDWFIIGTWGTLIVLSFRGCWMSMTFARRESMYHLPRVERLAAQRVLKRSRKAFVMVPCSMLSMLVACYMWFWGVDYSLKMRPEGYLLLSTMVSLVLTSRFVMFLAGLEVTNAEAIFSCVLDRWRRFGHEPIPAAAYSDWSSGDQTWDEKVRDLGSRGVSLRVLLHFYWTLGSQTIMPHFDFTHHTTGDVVRQAIIPATADTPYGSCALSDVLMAGRDAIPGKLVTHSWSNLFVNLVAAIVADALDLPVYDHLVERLTAPRERHALMAELCMKGRLDLTYWVCAVCVNQHTLICDKQQGSTTDSTGAPLFVCSCNTPKYASYTPPTRADNQSIRCEVNKFDDMMAWLASVNPSFGQCIAVDTALDLFSRAWCVAEIHCAYTFDMVQGLRVFNSDSLVQNQRWLRGLRVETMQASNPDDKDMILAKIGDTRAFNKQVQRLIFSDDGLLSTWRGGMGLADALQVLAKRAQERAMVEDEDSSTESVACGSP
eukprot:TRINITY_DN8385_c0_g2_i1.p1 TRINITY_DN8385_c0_g2~~TRINITY_DN8385_c0_g2_i1.p1  ORF type:complete len:783 (+),score=80.87 TRINITY_DN8385_c0_g2_i1:33-2381(+)